MKRNHFLHLSIRIVLLPVLSLALSTGLAAQDTTHIIFGGYMRSGFGVDGKGKPLDVFRAPDTDAKYRLGNEAEAYVEAIFGYAFEDENNARFETNLRLAFVTPTSKSNAFLTTTSVREAYVLSRGIIRKQPTLSFWAGQRFYDRHDVHMNDYFYRDMSGFGGGFENLLLWNSVKLSVAFLGGSIDQLTSNGNVQPENEFVFNKTTLDMTLYDIAIGFGKLGLTIDLSRFTGDSFTTPDGSYLVSSNTAWSGGIFHEIPFTGGRNLFNLFYGTGAAENYKAVITQPLGVIFMPAEVIDVGGFRRFRVINDIQADLSSSFSLQGLVSYQRLANNQSGGNTLNWFSAGVRPAYHFNRYFSLVGEVGMDYSDQVFTDSGYLLKATIAPQISPLNRIMSRPALRAYFTYAKWSDSFIGRVATGSFASSDHGISFGLQMEVWW